MFTNKLAPKFILSISLLIAFTAAFLSSYIIWHEARTIQSERTNYADSLARNLAYNAEYGVLTRNKEILENLITGIMKEKDVISVEITDKDGRIMSAYGKDIDPFHESRTPIVTKKIDPRTQNSEDVFFAERPAAAATGAEEKIGQVRLKISLIDMQRRVREVTMKIIQFTFLLIVISIAFTIFLVRKITLPLNELVYATEKISDGDLEHKVSVTTADEIGKLATSFNKMTYELSRTLVSKDYVDNIIKSMIDTLIVTNPDATIKTVNLATLNLLGYQETDLIGKPVGILFAAADTKAFYKEAWIDNLLKNGSIQNIEENYLAKNGDRIPVLLSGAVMKNEKGEIQGIVYVALDITERKRAEERLRQSEERYRTLVETAPDVIYSISINDATIMSLNPAFDKLTGWKREDWLGRPQSDLIHPDDLPLAHQLLETMARGITPESYELRIRHSSGQYLLAEFTAAPIFDNGRVVAIFGIGRDITERKKAEQEKEALTKQLLQSEKMAAVGQLAGGVAHEINNPLGVILGFSQSVIRRIKEDDPLFMPLASIEREAKRCKNLVQDLLTFSRVGKTEKERCDLNSVINSALTLVEAQTKVKSVELIREFGEKVPEILISRNQVQQVIVNLSNNAIDAMPGSGKLIIRTKTVNRGTTNYAQIDVEDNGSGIPKEIQTKIFEPFFTTKEVGKGTGLGLSLVYEIIQKHQGILELESEPGQGTVFRILIPYTESDKKG